MGKLLVVLGAFVLTLVLTSCSTASERDETAYLSVVHAGIPGSADVDDDVTLEVGDGLCGLAEAIKAGQDVLGDHDDSIFVMVASTLVENGSAENAAVFTAAAFTYLCPENAGEVPSK